MAPGNPPDRDGAVAALPRPAPPGPARGEARARRPGDHHQALLDAMPGHTALLDGDGAVISVNESWRRFRCASGLRSVDVGVGENYPTLCEAVTDEHAEDSRRAARGIRSVLSGEAAEFSLEYRCHSPDEERWFRMSVTPLHTDVPVGAVVMHVDISEARRAGQAMQASPELLQAVFAGSPDMIFVKDRDSRFLMCNEATASFAGHTVEYMIGRNATALYGAEVARLMIEGDRRVIDEDRVFKAEEVLTGASGTRTVLTTKAPYRNEQGVVVGVLGIVRDISERKRAELERDRERQFLRMLIDMLPDLVYTKDDGGRFTVCNRTTLSYFGFAHEREMTGKTLFDLLPADVAGPLHAADLEVLAGHPMLNHEERNLDRTDTWQWHSKIKMPLRDAAGKVTGLVGISRNITGLRRGQDALRELNSELEERVLSRTDDLNRARQEAEHANRAKSAFLATMSHEIRTPMNGVIGMLDVLHRTSLKGYQVEMVDLIRDSAFSLLRIIEDVLDFSKIEAGKLSVEQVPIDLAGTVEKVCAMLDQMAIDRGVGISVFVDPAIAPTVSGDEMRLRQILVNLVSNAIKFSGGRDQPGRVSVRALLRERRGDASTIELIVADNGIGMDKEALALLFIPFSQAEASTTRRFGGSGLGLAISEMLVHVMGGTISVDSVPGEGSTFTVRLTFTGSSDVAQEPPRSAADALHCRIVGDEQPLADDLTATLVHAGHLVERSRDLAAAAAAVPPPGLALWLLLPGLAVPPAAELRAMAPDKPGAETRFVVLGHGQRRRPRVEAADLVGVDVDLLLREPLLKLLALASGRAHIEADDESPAVDSHRTASGRDAKLAGGLILVAEDNETNRKVILLQLQLLGFAADVAVNGREALERWRRGGYALLLTDLHMPDIDGYALTEAIRSEEPPGQHLPIIALTANVMRDEETRCRVAGMDAYLTKPVRLPQLKAAIEVWLGAPKEREARGSGDSPPADLAVLGALVGHDPTVIAEVLQAFRKSAEQTSRELNLGVAAGSGQVIADAAHRLKAAARSIGAHRLGEICADIEQAAESGQGDALSHLLLRFAAELQVVDRFLDAA